MNFIKVFRRRAYDRLALFIQLYSLPPHFRRSPLPQVAICKIALCVGLLLGVVGYANQPPLYAQEWAALNDAPQLPAQNGTIAASALHARGGLTVNLADRQEVLAFYRAVYLPSNNIPPQWDGDLASCRAGTTSSTFRQAIVRRINYFRAMAGVPADIVLSDEYNRKAQQAALMMSANQQLSHTPPDTWNCHTPAGAEAAGSANLYLGVSSADAIDGYIRDPGEGNQKVGHRSWILYPQTQAMGTGDIPRKNNHPAANALWVFDNLWDARPPTREEFVSWPPPGHVPYTVIYPRWSFSYPDADFKDASISVTQGGANVPLTIEAAEDGGQRSVLVWRMQGIDDWVDWAKPTQDTAYAVTVRGVKIKGQVREFSYVVTVFDPETADSITPPVSVNHAVGAPGSFFTVVGREFAPNAALDVGITGGTRTTVSADAQGRFAVILDSDGVGHGTLKISVTPTGIAQGAADQSIASAATFLTIDPAAPARVKEIPADGPAPVTLILRKENLYLPFVQR